MEKSLGVKLFDRSHRGLALTKAGRSLYQDARYIIQYCRDSVTRAKNAMQEDENIIRIGSSPMTPAQLLMALWAKINECCPDIKFQIVPFENTPENAREILGNLGKNIDVVLAIPGWANVHPLLKVIPVEWEHSIPYGILHSPEPTPTVQRFLDAAKAVSKELYG